MAITVPQLDRQVFTPGAGRDYVGHALQIAQAFPDYGKMFRDAQAAEIQRQAALLKYQTDLQKAQQFIDLYPEYRAAQIAQLRARAAQAQSMADTLPAYRNEQIAELQSRADARRNRGVIDGLNLPEFPKMPGADGTPSATDTPPTGAPVSGPTATEPGLDTATTFGL